MNWFRNMYVVHSPGDHRNFTFRTRYKAIRYAEDRSFLGGNVWSVTLQTKSCTPRGRHISPRVVFQTDRCGVR